jgi:hypothetical protein
MNDFPIDVLYDKLNIPILLLQATLPEFWDEIRTIQVKEFQIRFLLSSCIFQAITEF